jgi:hypothetical protein
MNFKKTFMTVTPLSKTVALILVVALPFAGFYAGRLYEQSLPNTLTVAPSGWKTYTNDKLWFSFSYPPELTFTSFEESPQHISDATSDFKITFAGPDESSFTVSNYPTGMEGDYKDIVPERKIALADEVVITRNIYNFASGAKSPTIINAQVSGPDLEKNFYVMGSWPKNRTALFDQFLSTITFK